MGGKHFIHYTIYIYIQDKSKHYKKYKNKKIQTQYTLVGISEIIFPLFPFTSTVMNTSEAAYIAALLIFGCTVNELESLDDWGSSIWPSHSIVSFFFFFKKAVTFFF